MSEKYFTYLIIVGFALSLALPLIYLHLKIKLKNLQKLTRLRVMKKQQKSENTVLFSSPILNDCCQILFKDTSKKAQEALANLTVGKLHKAIDYLKPIKPQLSLLLEAHQNAQDAYKQMLKQKISWSDNAEYHLFLALLAHILFDKRTMHNAIAKINPQKLNSRNKAYYNYCASYAYLYDGDMLSASQRASLALEYFRKKRYSHEGYKCYLLLGEIYRLSCVNDVAQTMIDAAIKINKEQNMPQYTAESTAALGMLMLFENRFEEADDKFNSAIKLAQTESLQADILNQKTLLYIAQDKTKEAIKEAKKAYSIFVKLKNVHGLAFSLQLLAQIYFNKRQYNKAIECADKASSLYTKKHNFSAMLECMYLSADILFKQNKLKKSEELLRKIIENDRKQKHNFHIANAYSLLGLIYIRRNDLQRAKVLLQQSLHLEQRHRRCEGLVSDYTNLAVIDILCGNHDNAKDNMQTALEYAKQTGNNELTELIEKKYQAL